MKAGHFLAALTACAAFAACAPAKEPLTPPLPRLQPIVPPKVAEEAPCVIEGDGEPTDALFHHPMPELTISATRGGPPLVRTQGDARHAIHGRWTELSSAGGDGRAHLELDKPGAFRISGYADLSAVRYRLRAEAAVVPDHVFLEVDSLVRILGAENGTASVVDEGPFENPRELPARVRCGDLGYEATTTTYRDAEDGATAHLSTLRLHDAPGGPLRFEADVGLVFVRVLEERDGFVRIEGARGRVRVAGWTPRALVKDTPQGAGWGGGGHTSSTSRQKGRRARITRATPLLGRARTSQEPPARIGELAEGASIVVVGSGADLDVIEVEDGAITAVEGAVLLARTSDLALTP